MTPLDIPANIAPVSREMVEKLRQYHALLLKWQEKINLVSPNTIPDAWQRHFIDSAQLAPLVPEGAINLYDLGSGAGFAGMVLAILRPGLNVTMIESDAKKCAFLSAVSRETGTPVMIVNKRIEAVQEFPAPDLVSARALASLPELFAYVWPWAREKPELRLIFPKGAQAQIEIKAAQAAGWTFEVALAPSKTEVEAQILTVTRLGKN